MDSIFSMVSYRFTSTILPRYKSEWMKEFNNLTFSVLMTKAPYTPDAEFLY